MYFIDKYGSLFLEEYKIQYLINNKFYSKYNSYSRKIHFPYFILFYN